LSLEAAAVQHEVDGGGGGKGLKHCWKWGWPTSFGWNFKKEKESNLGLFGDRKRRHASHVVVFATFFCFGLGTERTPFSTEKRTFHRASSYTPPLTRSHHALPRFKK
jgi:hypothetical protein